MGRAVRWALFVCAVPHFRIDNGAPARKARGDTICDSKMLTQRERKRSRSEFSRILAHVPAATAWESSVPTTCCSAGVDPTGTRTTGRNNNVWTWKNTVEEDFGEEVFEDENLQTKSFTAGSPK